MDSEEDDTGMLMECEEEELDACQMQDEDCDDDSDCEIISEETTPTYQNMTQISTTINPILQTSVENVTAPSTDNISTTNTTNIPFTICQALQPNKEALELLTNNYGATNVRYPPPCFAQYTDKNITPHQASSSIQILDGHALDQTPVEWQRDPLEFTVDESHNSTINGKPSYCFVSKPINSKQWPTNACPNVTVAMKRGGPFLNQNSGAPKRSISYFQPRYNMSNIVQQSPLLGSNHDTNRAYQSTNLAHSIEVRPTPPTFCNFTKVRVSTASTNCQPTVSVGQVPDKTLINPSLSNMTSIRPQVTRNVLETQPVSREQITNGLNASETTSNMQGLNKTSKLLQKIADQNRNTNKPVSIKHNGIIYKVVAAEVLKPGNAKLIKLSDTIAAQDHAESPCSQEISSVNTINKQFPNNSQSNDAQKISETDAPSSPPPAPIEDSDIPDNTDLSSNNGNIIMYYGESPGVNAPYEIAKEHACTMCLKTFKCSYLFSWHLKRHIDSVRAGNIELNDLRKCQHCLESFKTPFLLQCHIEDRHMLNGKFLCKICEISFESNETLMTHMVTRHVEKDMPYICELCKFRTSYPKQFLNHFKLRHADSKRVLCFLCFRMMSSNFLLKHLLKHLRQSCKKCRSCKLVFATVKDYTDHSLSVHNLPNKKIVKNLVKGVKKKSKPETSYGPVVSAVASNPIDNFLMFSVKNIEKGFQLDIVQTKSQRQLRKHLLFDRCVECGTLIGKLSLHFVKEVKCKFCKFVSACGRTMAKHVIQRHSRVKSSKYKKMENMCDSGCNSSSLLFCICGYSTLSGSKAATHLLKCSSSSITMCKRNGVTARSLLHKVKYIFNTDSKIGEKAQFIESIGLSSRNTIPGTGKITVTQDSKKKPVVHQLLKAARALPSPIFGTMQLPGATHRTTTSSNTEIYPYNHIWLQPSNEKDTLTEEAKDEIILSNVDLLPSWFNESMQLKTGEAEVTNNYAVNIRHETDTDSETLSNHTTTTIVKSAFNENISENELDKLIHEKELQITNLKCKIAKDDPNNMVDTIDVTTVSRLPETGTTVSRLPETRSDMGQVIMDFLHGQVTGRTSVYRDPDVEVMNLNTDTTSAEDIAVSNEVETVTPGNNAILQENHRPSTTALINVTPTSVKPLTKTNSAVQEIALPMAVDQENVSPRNISDVIEIRSDV